MNSPAPSSRQEPGKQGTSDQSQPREGAQTVSSLMSVPHPSTLRDPVRQIVHEATRLPQLHDVRTARRRLGVGLTKFYELIARGEIRTVKIGSRRLVSADAIADYIARLEGDTSVSQRSEDGDQGGPA
jgi:excisionase family DNA binding protein